MKESLLSFLTLEVASDDLFAPIRFGSYTYTFSVHEEALNPRLVGHYEVLSGQNIEVNVYDKETCPSNVESVGVVDCTSVYLARNRDRGDVDSKTYDLMFCNPDYGAGERTIRVQDFYVRYDQTPIK